MLVNDIVDRAVTLRNMHKNALVDRARFRSIMNGGADGIRALLGTSLEMMDESLLPAPNLLMSGLDRLAQKLGRVPNLRVDLTNPRDSERSKRKKEKLERIITSFDSMQNLKGQLPQVARWLPGYGFAVFIITTKQDADGNTYPCAELRDPYDCYPGYYGANQMPEELVTVRKVPVNELVTLYPELKAYYDDPEANKSKESIKAYTTYAYQDYEDGSWENSNDSGGNIIEYMNLEGTYIVHIGSGKIVDFVPNPLKSGPAFVVAKRYSFDQLQGQFDQTIGLMAAMAKINIMSVIAMEDAVFTETNVVGEIESGQYRKGRFAVNYLTPGSQVVKPVNNLPYQLFEQVGRIERHLRVVAGYPVQDDAISPNSFVTGRGLEELQSGVSLMVREYQSVLSKALEEVDYKRLELDELLFNKTRKPLSGYIRGAAFSENYTPGTDINKNYKTTRVYGTMAGFDEPQKIITGLQLLQAGIIDRQTMQEEMDGLQDLTKINDRITKERAERVLFESLLARSQQGDSQAISAISEIYRNPNKIDDILESFFAEEAQQQQQQQVAQAQQGAIPGQGPTNIQDVFAQIAAGQSG
jgi:hypothetical protein|tara:strand:- start:2792 stop:4543 length:1752 start_codon:yes stop_codon:yes gene_type:complete